MNGLGGLNKSSEGIVIGMVQLQLPIVKTTTDLAEQTQKIVELVGKARRNMATMDLVVFPEYALHGLSMDTNPEIMCSIDGPEVAALKQACVDNEIWGCFSVMENCNKYIYFVIYKIFYILIFFYILFFSLISTKYKRFYYQCL